MQHQPTTIIFVCVLPRSDHSMHDAKLRGAACNTSLTGCTKIVARGALHHPACLPSLFSHVLSPTQLPTDVHTCMATRYSACLQPRVLHVCVCWEHAQVAYADIACLILLLAGICGVCEAAGLRRPAQ